MVKFVLAWSVLRFKTSTIGNVHLSKTRIEFCSTIANVSQTVLINHSVYGCETLRTPAPSSTRGQCISAHSLDWIQEQCVKYGVSSDSGPALLQTQTLARIGASFAKHWKHFSNPIDKSLGLNSVKFWGHNPRRPQQGVISYQHSSWIGLKRKVLRQVKYRVSSDSGPALLPYHT